MTSSSDPTRQGAVLPIILTSFMLIVLDNSIVFTGLPHIQRELGFTAATLSWVSSIYALTFGGFMLLAARAGDLWGRRRIFIVGLWIFAITSIAISLAPSSEFLIAARAAQGFGAAIIAPTSLALLQDVYPAGPARSRAIGYYAATGGVSASIGLVVGGMFAEWISWRAGFFINGPIGLALIIAARAAIPASSTRVGRVDVAGAVTSTLGTGAFLLGITRWGERGAADAVALGSILMGVVVLALFVLIQRRAPLPLMPLRLFRSIERSSAYTTRALFMAANMGFYFFVSVYLQNVMGLGAALTGLAFVPSTVLNFCAAMLVGRLARRIGVGTTLLTTLAFGACGMFLLSRADVGSGYWTILALPMILVGISQGGSLVPLTMSGIAGVAPEDAGAASGLVNVAHQLGASLGIALLTAVAAAAGGDMTAPHAVAQYVSRALSTASILMIVAIGITIMAMLAKRLLPAGRDAIDEEAR